MSPTRRAFFILFFLTGFILSASIYGEEPDQAVEPQELGKPEPAASKAEIKKKNEFSSLQKLSGQTTDKIGKVILKTEADLVLDKAVFSDSPYVLTDGTRISQSHPAELDVFVWQIIEHEKANKTVFLFPSSGSGSAAGFGKYLTMAGLILENSGHKPVVLLGALNVPGNRELLGRLHDLRKEGVYYDFSTALSSPASPKTDAKPVLCPSLAVFFQNKAVDIPAQRDASPSLIDKDDSENEAGIQAEFESDKADIENHYREYADLQTDVFLLAVETSIGAAVRLNKITDRDRIQRINKLQLEFAAYYRKIGPLGLASGYSADKTISDLFLSIDDICGSNSKEIYLAFVNQIWQKAREKEEILLRLRTVYAERERALREEIETRLRVSRSRSVSDTFSSQPAGSIVFYELPSSDIQQQITMGLSKQDYNLVVFYPASANEQSQTDYCVSDPDQSAFERVLKDSTLPEEALYDLVIPNQYRGTYDSNPVIREAVRQTYLLCRSEAEYYGDSAEAGRIVITDRRIAGIGSLVSVAIAGGAETAGVKYYFLPGTEVKERTQYIETSLSSPDCTELEKKIFLKFAKILEAARDL